MKQKNAFLLAAAVLAATPLAAQPDTVARPQARVHVVQPGETLWDIARAYLNDPFLWPEIFRINTDVVEDPARIYPAERLLLPDGTPVEVAGPEGRTLFYPTGVVRNTVTGAEEVLVPAVTQGDYYRASFVAADAEVDPVGRLAEVISPTVVPLRRPPQIMLYDKVFVALEDGAGVRVGDRLHFLRPTRELRPFGRVFVSTGIATVAALEGNVATAVVVRMYDPVNPGDLALPLERFPLRAGVRPRPGAAGLQGRIVGFRDDHPAQSTEELAFLDVGRREGVREGDEFEAYLPREARDWGVRPEVPVARLQVVRVMERSATVRITGLQQPAIAVGLPVRRTAAMP
ncbi:MAG TPA: LysM peptidoglycan-binding domain-containing protein [Longimicrobiaceae bacterium]|nr:LysM peptidoglycan-binding domain-containing protein [Longimicrobiaceae bacterium]